MVKNLPAVQETWVRSLGQEDPLKKGMVTTPILLPGESHGQRSLAGYSHGVAKSQMQLSNEHFFIYNTCIWHMYKIYTIYIKMCIL